jgi:hypothetical protein
MTPEKTSSMTEFISVGSIEKMTFQNSIILAQASESTVQYGIHSIIDDYLDEILEECVVLQLTNTEMMTYKYKPWLLSYHIYNTTDLDFLILRLNNMISPKDFTKNKLTVIKPSGLELINKIYNAEKKYIRANRNTL